MKADKLPSPDGPDSIRKTRQKTSTFSQASDIRIQADEMIKIRSTVSSIYAEHTKQPSEIIEKWMDRDYFITPEEAVDLGLIDQVLRETPTRLEVK